jgi:hypothetical protein
MPRHVLLCVSCRCEIERIDIAGGRAVAICVGCEAYGDAGELAAGVTLNPPPPQLRIVHGGAGRAMSPMPAVRTRKAAATRR